METQQYNATFKGGTISYTVTGDRGPTVIFLHGFLENKEMWTDYAIALSKGRKIICIDLPGHGTSDCFGYVHSMELMAEAVLTVLKELNIRKTILIGHSLGGYVSLAFAELFPDMVKGLCLFFSSARADSEQKKLGRNQAIEVVKENHKSFIRRSIPLLFRPKNRPIFREEINELKQQALATPKQGIIAALEGMKNRKDREIVLQFAPYPVHFVIGKKDPVLPSSLVIEQTKNNPTITYTLFDEIGHMGFIEAKEECLKDIRSFILRC